MSIEVCPCGSGKRPTGYCEECRMKYCSECKFTHLYTPMVMSTADSLYANMAKES
jgi:hypothetical protein